MKTQLFLKHDCDNASLKKSKSGKNSLKIVINEHKEYRNKIISFIILFFIYFHKLFLQSLKALILSYFEKKKT